MSYQRAVVRVLAVEIDFSIKVANIKLFIGRGKV